MVPRTQSALSSLDDIIASTSDSTLSAAEARVQELVTDVANNKQDTQATIQYARSTQGLNEIRTEWTRKRTELDGLSSVVEKRVSDLTDKQRQVAAIRDLWATASTPEGELPAALQDSVSRVQQSASEADIRLHASLDSLIPVQVNIATAGKDIDGILSSVDAAQKGLRNQIFALDSPPIWSAFRNGSYSSLRIQVSAATNRLRSRIVQFYNHYWSRLVGYLLFFIFLTAVLFWLPRAASRSEDHDDREKSGFLRYPIAVSAFISLILFAAFFPQAPLEVLRLAVLLLIVCSVILAARVFDRSLLRPVTAIASLRVMDTISANAAAGTLLQRIDTLLIAILASGVFTWLGYKGGAAIRELERRRWPVATVVCRISAVLLAFSVFTNIIGNVSLAEILLSGTLKAAYAGVIVYLFYTISRDLLFLYTNTKFSQRSRVIRYHRDLFVEKTTKIFRLICWIAWIVVLPASFQFAAEIFQAVGNFLRRSWSLGAVKISLQDILMFGIVLLLSTFLARVVRFFLEEELLPRTRVSDGAGKAGSRLLHYSLVFLGFFLALGAAGLDLSRLTLLTGAFGVGLGFGLQNVVSNFVSGIIISLERPMQVNDVIEVGTLLGTVREIGFRSSTVVTFDGAAVIVPNSELITKSFVNWSLTDRLRRGEIRIGVAYGTDPGRVLNLLREVVDSTQDVLKNPAPLITFETFGASSLDFTVRFWAYIDNLVTIRSQLNVAISERMQAEGISIPFPQRDVHVHLANGNESQSDLFERIQKGKTATS
ncbi:mechanosensitive ion channel family protein [Candidatus Korobacter versatilis]|uniref:mechanosensitive ion channel family protein n=1 Tax=Candidatus Korobacter versatilis TaxID=658062 RepID=UPI001E50ACBE|nr:mechanosensitive ion channel domain-containing protein [Candidatus Koribacter versatilis]